MTREDMTAAEVNAWLAERQLAAQEEMRLVGLRAMAEEREAARQADGGGGSH